MNPKHKKYKENNMKELHKQIDQISDTNIFTYLRIFFLILRNKASTESKKK